MSIKLPKKLMLLGSGELGKEFAIAAQRLGNYVIAVDRYANAPAMQVADAYEVISMLSADDLEAVVTKHQPDIIIPEIEAIRTEKLIEFEQRGITVIPTAAATNYTNHIAKTPLDKPFQPYIWSKPGIESVNSV